MVTETGEYFEFFADTTLSKSEKKRDNKIIDAKDKFEEVEVTESISYHREANKRWLIISKFQCQNCFLYACNKGGTEYACSHCSNSLIRKGKKQLFLQVRD